MSAAGAPAGAAASASPAPAQPAPGGSGPAAAGRSYGSGARILSIGLALTGVVTLGFFVLASHALNDDTEYGRVSLLWAITFMITSVIYRPIEQLLARSIADARARGSHPSLRTPITLQAGSAVTFVIAALLLRHPLQHDLLGGEAQLYWVLVGAVTTYSLSYFARGWLAGSGRPELYGALVFIESSGRCLFPIIALLGITHGTLAVALGISAAPLLSLAVVPLALRGGVATPVGPAAASEARDAAPADLGTLTASEARALGAESEAAAESLATETQTTSPATGAPGLSLRAGAVFAGSTVVVMFCEQLLINAAVFIVALTGNGGDALNALAGAAGAGAAGAVFNAFLVSRAPLQLFQAIQSTLLPHLAALSSSGDKDAAAKALRMTMLVIAGFAVCVVVGLLAVGPFVMHHAFKSSWEYTRVSLAFVGLGMGLHLAAGTLNQSALAHGRAPVAAGAWAVAAVIFVAFMLAKPFDDAVLRAAVGYAIAAGALLGGLLAVESRSLRRG
ncbi:MAG: hypothetical protein AAGC46_21315 [Solirubrobacteraceae bacterium]